MKEFFYDFRLNGTACGYSYLGYSDDRLLSVTRFRISENDVYTNRFELKLAENQVVALKYGDQDWTAFAFPAGYYPSCAYPILLPFVTELPFDYIQVAEADLSIVGQIRLQWNGDDIVETQAGQETRRFTMRNGVPMRIDWGGALSVLHESAASAVAGSGLTFTIAPAA